MSAFSYISFPREVDKSCLISRVDESKCFLLGEIRGTEIEKQYLDVLRERTSKDIQVTLETISILPDNMIVYLGDESDFHGISISAGHSATFNDVFTNQFIYAFMAIFKNNNDNNNYIDTDSDSWRRIQKDWNDNDKICRQQLYDIVQANIKPNEIVEIYTDWVDNRNIYNFGPPAEVAMIDAEQILSLESLSKNNFCSGIKIEIRRNE